METLEHGLLSRWVGNCVVLGLNSRPHNCSDMFLPLPVVCGLWCISMICPSVNLSLPTFVTVSQDHALPGLPNGLPFPKSLLFFLNYG